MGCFHGKQRSSGKFPASNSRPESAISSTRPSTVVETSHSTWPRSSQLRSPIPSFPVKDQTGWPVCFLEVAGDALRGLAPRSASSFKRLAKIGSGAYSNVYKARDLDTGRLVALKKVRFFEAEPESMSFMAREIIALGRLDHPNVVRLEGIVVSRVSAALYLVFDYTEHDLAGLLAKPGIKFSESQVKCYMKQLLSGLEHCHNRGVLHRDIKCSNVLIDNKGILKIADFGLARTFDPDDEQPMTSYVVALYYRAPELILGEKNYGIGVDLWSVGCILGELLLGEPILPGSSTVDQMYRIIELCGAPSEDYWENYHLALDNFYNPPQHYKRSIAEKFKDFSASSQSLIDKLLSLEPSERGTATSSLNSEFFTTEPFACEPSSLPQYSPSKEMDAELRHTPSKRQRVNSGKRSNEATRKLLVNSRRNLATLAPEANAELHVNLGRLLGRLSARRRTQNIPPPHQGAATGINVEVSHSDSPYPRGVDASFATSSSAT